MLYTNKITIWCKRYFIFFLSSMTSQVHYFNQPSQDSSFYKIVRGVIDKQNFQLSSAKWLFSAEKFDLWTRILLKIFSLHHTWSVSLLDLWCGYGLISSFLASQYTKNIFSDLKELSIDACDSSPLAVDVTAYNLSQYNTKWFNYNVLNSDVLSDNYFSDKKYNTILTNPPFSAGKKTVTAFIEQSYSHLVEGWVLWMVVPTNKWAKSYVAITEEIFWKNNIRIVALEAGYRVRTATK